MSQSSSLSSSESSSSLSSLPLSTYPVEKLLLLWRREELTADQAVGHLLQHMATLEAQALALHKQVQTLQGIVQALIHP